MRIFRKFCCVQRPPKSGQRYSGLSVTNPLQRTQIFLKMGVSSLDYYPRNYSHILILLPWDSSHNTLSGVWGVPKFFIPTL